MNIQILHRDQLPLGGFAGLKEHRLVVDQRIGGDNDAWDGLGNFVYLADARFQPNGETHMHSHKEIDVISILVEGGITHEGSLKHGQSLDTDQAQAQRAGGEGFSHNEINPDDKKNRLIQLWVLPETEGEPASYKLYTLEQGKLTRIYGGSKDQDKTLDSHTIMEVGMLSANQEISKNGEFLAYITRGKGQLNNEIVKDGDLIRGDNLNFKAVDDVQIIVITTKGNNHG
ncbi:pirin family protein [Candidatus Marithrix sp. Canyon 246]|uniref:pirin family protein n=1 Tax=Candidatus Marithrix sp. Canyon 246 TaxID=1827136 RepID=UPI000AA06970|nr:pirin family protein [Candidatus Marithrix sp. Canyon 246]